MSSSVKPQSLIAEIYFFFYPDKISNTLQAIKLQGKSLFPLRPLQTLKIYHRFSSMKWSPAGKQCQHKAIGPESR